MISVKADLVLRVILVGVLSTLTACAKHTEVQTQTQAQPRKAGEVKPSSTINGAGATQELVPVSAPAATEPTAPAPQIPGSTARPSNDGDDPRAVIEWLLDRSSRGR